MDRLSVCSPLKHNAVITIITAIIGVEALKKFSEKALHVKFSATAIPHDTTPSAARNLLSILYQQTFTCTKTLSAAALELPPFKERTDSDTT